jgi:L-methionine (R)-S-oxide reductase
MNLQWFLSAFGLSLCPAQYQKNTFRIMMNRSELYDQLDVSMPGLISDADWIANQANFAAALFASFGWHWVGFYRVEGEELLLGPFQGPVACTRLHRSKGVCSAAWRAKKTVVVEDVEAFEGHIACSAASRSEIVLPLCDGEGVVRAVLDIDSAELDDFSAEDQGRLEALLASVCNALLPK